MLKALRWVKRAHYAFSSRFRQNLNVLVRNLIHTGTNQGLPCGGTMATIASRRESDNVLGQRRLLAALRAFRRGDFTVRLPHDLSGLDAEIAEAFNDCIELNAGLTKELERVS